MNPDIHVDKLQYALKHLGRSALRVKERQLSRKDLAARFQKVKSSAKKGHEVAGDIEELENVLRQVLKNERDMLEQQKRYADLLKAKLEELSPNLNTDLKKIQEQLERNLEAENLHASEYKSKINQLADNLSEVEKEEIQDLRYNRDQIDKVNRGISEIRENMGAFSPARLDLLEKRIRSDVQQNRKQLLLIEQEIRHLERKSKELKMKGVSKEALGKVDEKIEILKKKSSVIKEQYPPSTQFEPKKIDIMTGKEIQFKPRTLLKAPEVKESKEPWRPPKFADVKRELNKPAVGLDEPVNKRAEIEKSRFGIAEPKKRMDMNKPRFAMTEPKKDTPELRKPQSMKTDKIETKDHHGISEILIPKRSVPTMGVKPSMPPPPSIENLQEFVPEPPKAPKDLPKLEPDMDLGFDMPPEFETPKKVSMLKKIKDWFGL